LSSHITFSDFSRLLQRLGFIRYHAPNPAWVFKNSEHDALIALLEYKEDEFVRPHHLVSARGLLDERGLMDRDTFGSLTSNSAGPSDEAEQTVVATSV
jgi:hypothetical protein